MSQEEKMYVKRILSILLILTIFLIESCDNDIFKYSIHETDSKYSGSDFNNVNAALIESLYNNPLEDFTFAVVTDSHTDYDKLDSAVSIINANPSIKFVIHLGDMTDTGLLLQYEMTVRILKKLHVPFVVAIGNHDLLGNGFIIFKDIFGHTNFSFTCNDVFFIIANDNNWESSIGDILQQFNDLLVHHQDARYRIIATHIPFTDDARYFQEFLDDYQYLCENYDVALSLHGHKHRHYYIPDFTSKTAMLSANAIVHDKFYLIHVMATGIEYEIVGF